jgi:hypothetical protein
MSFKDKFKIGDIICSDNFRAGLCMVVEKYHIDSRFVEKYTCQDLIRDGQKWAALEIDSIFKHPYNWRIATDDDIAKYLSRYLNISHKVGEYDIKVLDNCFAIEGFSSTLFIEADELIELKHIIEKRVGQ